MRVIAEISGADSIAAALAFVGEHHEVQEVVPTYVHTGTEFGDFSAIDGNVAWLRDELRARHGVGLTELIQGGDPRLWRALNGRFPTEIAERYGRWLPCTGCHLYLHLMRIPLAREAGATVVISGERENHDGRAKANQTAAMLDAYVSVLAEAGIELALPVRGIERAAQLGDLLGPRWPGGSPQMECVLSGNERGRDGGASAPVPDGYAEEFIRPVGATVAGRMMAGTDDWEAAVAEVLWRP